MLYKYSQLSKQRSHEKSLCSCFKWERRGDIGIGIRWCPDLFCSCVLTNPSFSKMLIWISLVNLLWIRYTTPKPAHFCVISLSNFYALKIYLSWLTSVVSLCSTHLFNTNCKMALLLTTQKNWIQIYAPGKMLIDDKIDRHAKRCVSTKKLVRCVLRTYSNMRSTTDILDLHLEIKKVSLGVYKKSFMCIFINEA